MGPKSRKTRRQSGDFGAPAELPDAGALPTIAAVKSEVTKSEATMNEDKEIEALIHVKDAVLKKYKEVCPLVPIIEEKSVYIKFRHLFEASKQAERKMLKTKFFTTFKKNIDRLFDLIVCHCEIYECGQLAACRAPDECTGFHIFCVCPLAHKRIPNLEVTFIKDQRKKIGLLGGHTRRREVDDEKLLAEATEKEKRAQAKKEKRAEDAARVDENIRLKLSAPEMNYNLLDEEIGAEEEMEENENIEGDYIALERKEESDRTTIDLELFVAELDRYSIPDRPGAALWNASVKAKEENGVLEKESENTIRKNLTVDRYKIRRE